MATQLEKLPKPVIEKRRRARINRCLEELKHLVPVIDVSLLESTGSLAP